MGLPIQWINQLLCQPDTGGCRPRTRLVLLSPYSSKLYAIQSSQYSTRSLAVSPGPTSLRAWSQISCISRSSLGSPPSGRSGYHHTSNISSSPNRPSNGVPSVPPICFLTSSREPCPCRCSHPGGSWSLLILLYCSDRFYRNSLQLLCLYAQIMS